VLAACCSLLLDCREENPIANHRARRVVPYLYSECDADERYRVNGADLPPRSEKPIVRT
jgi:hypothetical protein